MTVQPTDFTLLFSSTDQKGIVAAVANHVVAQACKIVEGAQLGDPENRALLHAGCVHRARNRFP